MLSEGATLAGKSSAILSRRADAVKVYVRIIITGNFASTAMN